MTHPEQDELQVLRERAYGPDADIHLDSAALQRLYELERRSERSGPTPVAEDADEEEDEDEDGFALLIAAEPDASAIDEPDAPASEPRRSAFRMRRSTLLIALALITLIVVSYTAFVLVQRVQADPLQAGASQVARLSGDDTYDVPDVFSDGSAQSDDSQAYQDFYGLRTVINGNGVDADDKCILVYPSDSVTEDGNFTGPAYMGCAAGAFPAAVAFRVGPGLPEALQNAFPDGTALQFVLDKSSGEIVVFADRGVTRS